MIDFDKVSIENRGPTPHPRQKFSGVGTVEAERKNRQMKRPKKDRPDATHRPMAGYIFDEDTQQWVWNETALLQPGGYELIDNWLFDED